MDLVAIITANWWLWLLVGIVAVIGLAFFVVFVVLKTRGYVTDRDYDVNKPSGLFNNFSIVTIFILIITTLLSWLLFLSAFLINIIYALIALFKLLASLF